MSWFEDWFNSPYYDKLYGNHNEQEACDFIKALTNYLKPASGAKIADIPCGRGRYSKLLATSDFDVYGFDLSTRDITEALKFEKKNLHFFRHDMRQPFYVNYFDFVLNIFTSLGYFETARMDTRVLKNFYATLKPKGKLVIDFLNSDYAIKHLQANGSVERDNVVFNITKEYGEGRIIKKVEVKDNGATHYFVEKVRTYSLNDFREMLKEANFTLIDTFGDYKLQRFDINTSKRLVLIAEKN